MIRASRFPIFVTQGRPARRAERLRAASGLHWCLIAPVGECKSRTTYRTVTIDYAMTDHTHLPSGGHTSVVALLRRRAAENPERLAYAFLADGETARGTVTYGELDRRAQALAATMQSLGLADE